MSDATSDGGPQSGFRHHIGRDGVPVRRAVAALTRSLQQICTSFVAEALAKAELVQLEYALMVFVNDAPGISQQTLSEAMGVDRNNVGLITEKLEARGLVRRSVNGDDRRARQVYLTPKGVRLWRQCQPEVVTANLRVLAPLNASEKKLFIDMLVRLVEGNRVHARPGAGRRKRVSNKSS